MSGSSFEAPTLGIGRLLREGSRFFVPHHQRDYSWTEDEIDQLFADIGEARTSGQQEYFIGLMVFMIQGQREFTILDGQQRLATTIIILSAVRSWLKARGYDRDANQIQGDYVAVRELGHEDVEPRLILNQNNNPYFLRYIIHEAPSQAIQKTLKDLKRYDPNRRLLQAILTCRTKVEELASEDAAEGDAAAQRLFELVRYLRDGVKLVRLTVHSEADAYTVFETLNDRGLDLSVLDLVKNYLFGKAGNDEHLRDVQARWTQMMANLVNVPADDFLKVWWTSRHGRVQTAQLFPKFKDRVRSWHQVARTSEDMLLVSEQYAALEIADDPIWADLSDIGRGRIRSLKVLGAKQVHPVLLSALEKFSTQDLERLLRLLEVLIVRYQLIGGGRTGRLEITAASVAHQIWEGQVKSATDAFRIVKDIYPSDTEFRESFQAKQERSNQKASWVLAKLEGQARQAAGLGHAAHELEPSGSLTLEHVLPKSPGIQWKSALEADPVFAEEVTFRLGNMCLLTKINRALGNKSFAEKKKIYSESDLILTKEITKFEEWNRMSLDHRQAHLAKLAVALWRFE